MRVKAGRKRFLSLFMAIVLVVGLLPAFPMPGAKASGSGESWADPILIDSMEQLFTELKKDTSDTETTYYRLKQDIYASTKEIRTAGMQGSLDLTRDNEYDFDINRKTQCYMGTGKKHLELMGHDIHFKNNYNSGIQLEQYNFNGGKQDSLTLFILQSGTDLIVSNTTKERAQVWYDGFMCDRTGWFNGPNYTHTVVRDVFRVNEGAKLTLNNTDVKAGRNRKIWMVHALYRDKEKTTNLGSAMNWDGFAYEQIYGSAVVVNGGKVTINGGWFEGRGGYRNGENVSGGNGDYDYLHDLSDQVEEMLSNVGAKAAVQIAAEGSEVVINDGEFWGCGGANVIGVNALNGNSVTDYKLEIHSGTFDTSKTDKERLPDHVSTASHEGFWGYSWINYYTWCDCHAIRDTLRGRIGIPAVDGKGNPVVDLTKSRIYIEDEDPEDEVTATADADFSKKSDHDTIIIKPKEKNSYFSCTENRLGQKAFVIYATDETYKNTLGGSFGSDRQTLAYEQGLGTHLWFTAESMFDLTDEDNAFFFNSSMRAICTWTLYEVTESGSEKKVETTTSVMSVPTLQYVKDGKMLYVYKLNLDNWQRTARSSYNWKQDAKVSYYMTASVDEYFGGSLHTIACHMDNTNMVTYGLENEYSEGLPISVPVSFQNNLRDKEGAVKYSNACYGCDPQIELSQELQNLKSSKGETFVYQWQVLRDGQWEDYGNWRISTSEAINVINKHSALLGETVRLKITGYDKKIKGELYSNACKVLEGRDLNNVEVPAVEVSYDPNHEGKYVFTILVENDWQEYLVLPVNGDSPTSRIRYLDWSNATRNKVIDNLDSGTYDIFTRYAAVEGMEAGKKVEHYREMALVEVPAQDAQITYRTRTAAGALPTRNDPVLSDGDVFYVVVGGDVRTFDCVSVPFEANDGTEGTTLWKTYPYSDAALIQPMTVQHDRSTGTTSFVETDWGTGIEGRTFMFKGLKQGICHLTADTTLPDGTVKRTTINIFVASNDTVPYKITEASDGELIRLSPGQNYVPSITAYPETAQSTVETSGRVVWSMVARNEGDDLTHFTLNRITGELTVSEDALIGEGVIVTGSCRATRDITIDATYEVTISELGRDEEAHPGQDHEFTLFRQCDANQHYEICSCGEVRVAEHDYQDEIVKAATYTEAGTLRRRCVGCGYSFEEEIPIGTHVHVLYWNYDENEHWQNCEDEDCPEEEYETKRGSHSYVEAGADEDGKKIFICSVCGAVYNYELAAEQLTEDLADSGKSVEEKVAEVRADSDKAIEAMAQTMSENEALIDQLVALEAQYASDKGISSSVSVSHELSSVISSSAVTMVGGVLSASAGDTVSLSISKTEAADEKEVDASKYSDALQLDIKLLVGGTEKAALDVPVQVTIPVPAGIDVNKLVIRHYNADDTYEEVDFKDNGDGTVSFVVTHFSTFVILQDLEIGTVDESLNFATANLTLQDNLAMNFKVEKSLFTKESYGTPYVKFLFNGSERVVEPNPEYLSDATYYWFTCNNIAPQMIGDAITATLYVKDGGTEVQGATKIMSPKQYLYTLLGLYTSKNKLTTLLVDLLNYGAAAQVYVNYKTDALVNADLTAEQAAWGTAETRSYDTVLNAKHAEIDSPGVNWTGIGLTLNETVAIRYKIDATDLTGLTVKVTDDLGHEWTYVASDLEATSGGYYLYFRKLQAKRMSDKVYATVYRDGVAVSNTLCYSIESYVNAMQSTTDANLKNLINAMIKYGDAAKAY